MKPYRYLKRAREELLVQVEYYEGLEPGLGLRFWHSIEAAIGLACLFPKSGTSSYRGTRKVFPKDFPFAVFYFEAEQELRVVAVAHFRRKPHYWKARSIENLCLELTALTHGGSARKGKEEFALSGLGKRLLAAAHLGR